VADEVLVRYRSQLIEQYLEQIEAYRRHLHDLDPSLLHAPIKPGEWSPHQVVFHIAAVDERAYGPRLLRILEDDRPDLDDFDEAEWMSRHYDPDLALEDLLASWSAARLNYAGALRAAPEAAWNRTGLQPYWGERTLQWWLERAVTHGDDHFRQLNGE
jgi:hypothetical protein